MYHLCRRKHVICDWGLIEAGTGARLHAIRSS